MKKIFFIIVSGLVIWYCFWSYYSWISEDYFKVFFFDVGQGDSALIITPGGKTILIDGGPNNQILRGLGETLPFWQRQIDLLIITHAHDDHILGLIELSRRYKIKQVLYNNLEVETPVLKTLTKIFQDKKIKLVLANSGMSFNFINDCSLKVLSASKELGLDENDYSIVTSFNCLDKKIIFTGDAGVKIEQSLLDKNLDLKADILKISHHGSASASSETFLKRVNPRVAIISVGENNSFNHPSPIILDRLSKLPVDIYRTDQVGLVYFLANNKVIRLIK